VVLLQPEQARSLRSAMMGGMAQQQSSLRLLFLTVTVVAVGTCLMTLNDRVAAIFPWLCCYAAAFPFALSPRRLALAVALGGLMIWGAISGVILAGDHPSDIAALTGIVGGSLFGAISAAIMARIGRRLRRKPVELE
jgi:membrane associated rhomboid family serine protease